ncbi:hypothetical protein [uncultured Draconibacterium sp.]|uniref:hypothetical protein n=1 Tax=uncultured Draconibacterium sp. TaxID=1573823 RepID=UPI0032168E35
MNKTPKTFTEVFNLRIGEDISIDSIEIPIIQRDYAQGRESKEVTRIRKQFLKVLYDALTGEIGSSSILGSEILRQKTLLIN